MSPISSKNRTKTSLIVVKLNSFIHFLEETSAWKNHFDFVWPLVGPKSQRTWRKSLYFVNTINVLLSFPYVIDWFFEKKILKNTGLVNHFSLNFWVSWTLVDPPFGSTRFLGPTILRIPQPNWHYLLFIAIKNMYT